jgi:hypothetical protein
MGKYNLRVKNDDYRYVPGAEAAGRQDGGNTQDQEQQHISFKRLLAESKPERRILAVATVALFVSALCNLAIPALFGRIIDSLTAPPTGDAADVEANAAALRLEVVGLGSVSLIGAAFSFVRGYLFNLAGERVVSRLRTKLFHSLLVSRGGRVWRGVVWCVGRARCQWSRHGMWAVDAVTEGGPFRPPNGVTVRCLVSDVCSPASWGRCQAPLFAHPPPFHPRTLTGTCPSIRLRSRSHPISAKRSASTTSQKWAS